MSMVPLLLIGRRQIAPLAPDFRSVPKLLNSDVPLAAMDVPPDPWTSNRAPARLLNTALVNWNVPARLRVIVPTLSTVWLVMFLAVVPVNVDAPVSVVFPVPVKVPPLKM